MSNAEFNNIKVPDNIDIFIENGVKKVLNEKKIRKNIIFKKISMVTAASLVALVVLNITNPAFFLFSWKIRYNKKQGTIKDAGVFRRMIDERIYFRK